MAHNLIHIAPLVKEKVNISEEGAVKKAHWASSAALTWIHKIVSIRLGNVYISNIELIISMVGYILQFASKLAKRKKENMLCY